MSKEHRENVIDYIKRNDIQAMQGAPVTEEMIQRAWNRIVTPPPASKIVTLPQLEARADHARHVETHLTQLRRMEAQQNYEAMSDDERSLLASEQLVELSRAKLAKARNMRQHAAVERYELEVEQREAVVTDQKSRLAKLAERRTTDLQLQSDDPDWVYALTSAEATRDILDPMSDDAVQNSVHLAALKSATPETARAVVKEFHAWEATRFARIRAEQQQLEAQQLQDAAPAINAMHAASQAAADAGLRAADAIQRATKGDN